MQTLKDEVRERIIQAAQDDFFASGFSAASTRRIIKNAGISNGNLYNYFQSKEELFDAIADPFCGYLGKFMLDVFNGDFSEDFSEERIAFLSAKIAGMLEDHRKEFIIVMDRSEGTKHASFKSGLIDGIADHFQKNVKQDFSGGEGEGFIMRIIAINFVEGLLGIAGCYKSPSWARENVKLLLQYHSNGVAQFY